MACVLLRHNLSVLPISKKQLLFINNIKKADLVINYGSGGINDIFGEFMILKWGLIYKIAKIFSIPSVVTGQGIGPIERKFFSMMLRRNLKSVQHIAVREKTFSPEYLKSIGVRKSKVYPTADDAIALPSTEINIDLNGVKCNEIAIGVHLRGTNYDRDYDALEKKQLAIFLDFLGKSLSAKIYFIPMCYNPKEDDRNFFLEISKLMTNKNTRIILDELSPSEIKNIVGKMSINIGFSYHFILFSLTCGVPAIGFYTNKYYELKIKGLMNLFGQDCLAFKYSKEDYEIYVECIKKILNNKFVVRTKLIERTKALGEEVFDFYKTVVMKYNLSC
jgi:polysaccharide pyruvyl transferase WcaK-like protein